ncbi:MAG: secondary thiamine-phosphate synthase enzyme YjbQ [Candidatus Bathyarchaeota archaeon]
MKFLFREVPINTKNHVELIDVTDDVETFLRECEIKQGICGIYLPHSTAAIVMNEHEKGLMRDIISAVERLCTNEDGWLHDRINTNASAYLASTILGSSRTFPIKDGRLIRGRWQNIFLLELDGPRPRTMLIQIIGEERTELTNFK